MKKIFVYLFVLILISFNTYSVENKTHSSKILNIKHDKDYTKIDAFYRVFNKDGSPVLNINKKDIILKFNGKTIPVKLNIATGETGKLKKTGVSTIIILDASGSVNEITRREMTEACKSFINQMGQGDETGIFLFNNLVIRLQELTGDKNQIIKSLDKYRTSGTLSIINNAIFQSIEYLNQKGKNTKKVLVIISDGLDEGSTKTPQQVIEIAKKFKIPIYSMGYTNINPKFFENLQNLSNKTGGLFSLKNSIQLAKKILAVERSTLKLSFKPDDLKKENEIKVIYKPHNLTATYKFQISDEVYKKLIEKKKRLNLIIILSSLIAVILILLIIILLVRKNNRKYSFTSEETLLISKLINDDAIDTTQEIKNIYLKAINKKELERKDFLVFSARLKELCNDFTKELTEKNKNNHEKKKLNLESIKRKLELLENKSNEIYKTKQFFVEPFKTQIVYIIEGRIAHISEYEKKAFSKIILANINKRLESAQDFPLTLAEVDHYSSILTKHSYNEEEIQRFIEDIQNSLDLVDEETQTNAELGIQNLKKLINQGRRKYKIGNMITEPFLSQIKEKLLICKKKLNQLNPDEKKALTSLALKDIKEHKGNIKIYDKIIKSTSITSDDIEKLYKRLSSELMYCKMEEQERSIDCSALYKISMSKDCVNKDCKKEDIFGAAGCKKLLALLKEVQSKKINPEVEKELDSLIEAFISDTDDFIKQNRDSFYESGSDIEIDSMVENFLFKSFSAGIEGFDLNSIFREMSSYDDETLAKLMPYMIQIVKDSQGTEKEANLGILKNLANNLKVDIPPMSDVSEWEDWWKNNKTNVMNEIATLDEKEHDKKSLNGFYIHEDIGYYKFVGNKIEELHGRILDIKGEVITLLLYDLLELEEIVGIYSRVDENDVLIVSTYSFLRCMWITEIEDNLYEAGFVFLKTNEGAEADKIVEKIAGVL